MKTLPNILIVDDTLENLIYLEAIIEQMEANLIKALSGYEALEKTLGIELALAIIDVRMPGMNGYELAVKLNEERSEFKVPIIFLTAINNDLMQASEGYLHGAVDYLFKPVQKNILLCKIKVFLDLHNQKRIIIRDAAILKKTAEELVRVKTALKSSEEKYRNYIESAPDGVFVADGKGMYIEVNAATCNITGYSKEELLKMSVADLLPEWSYEDGIAQFENVLKTGISKSDLLFLEKDLTNQK